MSYGQPPFSSPSLVYIGQGVARKDWDRTRRRRFGTTLSFMKETVGQGCQLLRVDLTTAPGGDSHALKIHFHELQRRIRRVFGYDIKYDVYETSEGNGTLHMIWAILADHAVWMPQGWLSETWEAIHGAKIVYIKRVRGGRDDWVRISRYMISKYFNTDQPVVSHSYSWWSCRLALGKSFNYLRRELLGSKDYSSPWGFGVREALLTWRQFLDAWDELLLTGSVTVGKVRYFIQERGIEKCYAT